MSWKALSLSAFGISMGILLLVLACALSSIWWPMMALIPYFILPIPTLLCSQVDSSLLNSDDNGWKVIGDFITGFLTVSIFAIPAVIYHMNAISSIGLILSTVSNIIIFSTILGYLVFTKCYGDSGVFSST